MKKPLLTSNNKKTIKSLNFKDKESNLPFMTYILYMSPFKANSKRINVCTHASKGCAESCLVGSGFGGMYTSVMQGRINRTEFFLRDRIGFLNQIKNEIEKIVKKHEGKAIVTIRLNGTSDLSYENFKVFDGKNIFELFPNIQFYDYTKNWTRFDKKLPANYHLTFSRSETNHDKAMEILNKGFNVAIVFDKLPKTYEGFEVINADENDLRFLDKKGVVCGLKYKMMTGKGGSGKNKAAFENGFALKSFSPSPSKKVDERNFVNAA